MLFYLLIIGFCFADDSFYRLNFAGENIDGSSLNPNTNKYSNLGSALFNISDHSNFLMQSRKPNVKNNLAEEKKNTKKSEDEAQKKSKSKLSAESETEEEYSS